MTPIDRSSLGFAMVLIMVGVFENIPVTGSGAYAAELDKLSLGEIYPLFEVLALAHHDIPNIMFRSQLVLREAHGLAPVLGGLHRWGLG